MVDINFDKNHGKHHDHDDECLLFQRNAALSGEDICDRGVNTNIVLFKNQTCKLEGFVKLCSGEPVRDVLLFLFRVNGNNLCKVGETRTDCKGFYSFRVRDVNPCDEFRIAIASDDEREFIDFRIERQDTDDCNKCRKKDNHCRCHNHRRHCNCNRSNRNDFRNGRNFDFNDFNRAWSF